MLASCQKSGTRPLEYDSLKIIENGVDKVEQHSQRTCGWKPSDPAGLHLSSSLKVFSTDACPRARRLILKIEFEVLGIFSGRFELVSSGLNAE